MKERLIQLMNYLGLNATSFSAEIGVQRSSISHILSGRNQPSFDFMSRTASRFPEINANWLLTGKGTISLSKDGLSQKSQTGKKEELFENTVRSEDNHVYNITHPEKHAVTKMTYVNNIAQVIIFYNDGTFSDYRPGKHDNDNN
jgi:hypothetical protein